jgi:hypothetical protein
MKDKETLEQLRSERDRLDKNLTRIGNKIDKLATPIYRAEYEKEYVDTYWKCSAGYREKDDFYSFIHVKKIIDVFETRNGPTCNVVCDIFEDRRDGMIIIRTDNKEYHPNNICQIKITKAAYEKEKASIIKKLQGI